MTDYRIPLYFKATTCLQKCLDIPRETVYSITANIEFRREDWRTFSDTRLANIQKSFDALAEAFQKQLGFTPSIYRVSTQEFYRPKVQYGIEVIGREQRDAVMAAIATIEGGSAAMLDFKQLLSGLFPASTGESRSSENPYLNTQIYGSAPDVRVTVDGGDLVSSVGSTSFTSSTSAGEPSPSASGEDDRTSKSPGTVSSVSTSDVSLRSTATAAFQTASSGGSGGTGTGTAGAYLRCFTRCASLYSSCAQDADCYKGIVCSTTKWGASQSCGQSKSGEGWGERGMEEGGREREYSRERERGREGERERETK